jgi:putative PIN family toxin of toxin-antitoxin system
MKPVAVLDSSVVVAAIGWRGEARNVLRLLARRAFISIRTPYLTQEWTQTLAELSNENRWPNPNWPNWLEWLKTKSRLRNEAPIKAIVRDPKDDPILAIAIAERAYLVSYDRDILDLRQPYGGRCVAPRNFIAAILARS